MKSSVETLNPTRVRLTVEVSFEELKPSLDAAYTAIARQVTVPGFRKGKAPHSVIDQRVGRGVVLDEAVNDAIPRFYGQAVEEADLQVMGRPELDVTEFVDGQDLTFTAEVDVRPEIQLPDYKGLTVTVDDVEVSDDDVAQELERLRERFGTLATVERAARDGDFVQLDLAGTVGGEVLPDATVTGMSYEVGSNSLGLDELDAAIQGLEGGSTATFTTTLLGGGHAGEEAEMAVTVRSVRERQLPELDDDFTQLASEFDTLDELRSELRGQVERLKRLDQGVQARDKTLEALMALVEVPIPENIVAAEVEQHFTDGHGDDEHRGEFETSTREAIRQQLVLDAIAEAEELGVEQSELADHLVRRAYRAGMAPDDFANQVAQSGAVALMVNEVRRGKALALVMESATVVDASGDEVDLEALGISTTLVDDVDEDEELYDGFEDDVDDMEDMDDDDLDDTEDTDGEDDEKA